MEEQTQNNQPQNTQPQPTPGANQSQGGGSDAEKNKNMAIIGYIIPILFFIPLVTDAKNSPFAKFHAGQQLNLFLAVIVVQVVGILIPIIGWFLILPIGTIAIIVLAIMGLIHASKGETKKLPIIGGFEIIK
ncbi:MAG: hypothetical protein COU40_00420 [Candidatus Moranbacteria bacterium CG10_big_fil_rev_8_21_14_0_10_35_21]|nr:MAG: hypothetical protein COU40_00420 [Candidatus Moranbacteria bacterium CG10_big_fil_rev_8_21_14_0_10_35_21]PJA88233.1 MAG: hypothetical protein CO139_04235 [Candidatus Moranbacteria bacterium CG_4_9_14_3_um_filter_36_9]